MTPVLRPARGGQLLIAASARILTVRIGVSTWAPILRPQWCPGHVGLIRH